MSKTARRNYSGRRFRRSGNQASEWVVKSDRPEESLGDPKLYYTDEEVERYARSGGMRRAQEKVAFRILELLGLNSKSTLLDMGCGVGYTAEVYRAEGYEVVGLDVMPNMVSKAKEKGLEVHLGDMREVGKIFSGRKFDGVVSASALQWIKDKASLKSVAQGVYGVLKDRAPLVIQLYPRSEQELVETARVFTRNGFRGKIITDSPDNARKRTVYLVMKRD